MNAEIACTFLAAAERCRTQRTQRTIELPSCLEQRHRALAFTSFLCGRSSCAAHGRTPTRPHRHLDRSRCVRAAALAFLAKPKRRHSPDPGPDCTRRPRERESESAERRAHRTHRAPSGAGERIERHSLMHRARATVAVASPVYIARC